jgi:putative toxin-antitoxin system antitoxin component (TIGR02293 family)
LDRIGLARAGVKASKVARAAALLRLPKEQLIKTLGFSRATVARKVSEGTALDQEQSSRLVGILALVGQIEDAMDDTVGTADTVFDAGGWVSTWLDQPLPALGQRKPGEFMDSTEGQMLVSRILAQTLAGAYV